MALNRLQQGSAEKQKALRRSHRRCESLLAPQEAAEILMASFNLSHKVQVIGIYHL